MLIVSYKLVAIFDCVLPLVHSNCEATSRLLRDDRMNSRLGKDIFEGFRVNETVM